MDTAGITLTEQVIAMLAAPLDTDPVRQGSAELCEVTVDLAAARRAVEIAEFRELDEMVAREGSNKAVEITAQWLKMNSELLLREARHTVKLAVRMCAHPKVLTRYAAGNLSRSEAKFIVDFLAHPPKAMPADARDQVLDYLLLAAEGRDEKALHAEADKVRETFSDAPNPGEDTDRNTFHLAKLSHGRYDLAGNVDTETGEALQAALSPYAAPRPEHDGTPDRRSTGQRWAEALGEFARHARPATENGLPARLSITIRLEDFFAHIPTHAERAQLIAEGRFTELFAATPLAHTQWGSTLNLEAARRLACDCELSMVATDSNGVPQHAAPGERSANRTQRRALAARDCGCAFPGCDRPVAWTQAHHIWHWADGGPTVLPNLVLLCNAHHVTVHNHGWDVAMGTDQLPAFRPPAKLDPLRRWMSPTGQYVDPPPPHPGLTSRKGYAPGPPLAGYERTGTAPPAPPPAPPGSPPPGLAPPDRHP